MIAFTIAASLANIMFLTGLCLGKNTYKAKREQALAPTKRGLSLVSRVRSARVTQLRNEFRN